MILDGIFEMFDNIKKWFKKSTPEDEAQKYVKAASGNKTKDEATARKEPYIAVLETHVNPENIRNGFFELDWNEYFVLQLKQAGYKGNTEEEIVNQWFQELCRNIGAEEGIDMERRGSGFINVSNLGNGRSEVS